VKLQRRGVAKQYSIKRCEAAKKLIQRKIKVAAIPFFAKFTAIRDFSKTLSCRQVRSALLSETNATKLSNIVS
jgi:hypothetical protein